MMCPAICDRWERIASTPETDVPSVDRLWRVLNAGMPSFHDADGFCTVMMCPAICDRWERIASTPETDVPSVDRLWRVLNAGMPSFHDADGFCTGCLLQFAPPLEVFRIDCKILPGDIFQQSGHAHPAASELADIPDGFCTGCLLQFAPPLEVFRIDCKILPGDIFQQSGHAHPAASELADIPVQPVPYLAAHEYGLAVFYSGNLQECAARYKSASMYWHG